MTPTSAPTSPAQTSSARAPLRHRIRRAAGAVAVALGLVLPLSAPGLALAEETPTPSPTPAHAGLQLSLRPDANGSYTPGSPLTTALAIRNDDTVGLDAGTVQLELGRTALTDRAAVSAWLDGSGAAPALSAVGEAHTGALNAGDDLSTAVIVPAADIGAISPGVYPVRANFRAATTGGNPRTSTATAPSVLIVAGGAPASVVTIVPITATPTGPLLSAAELTALTAPTGALTAQLNGVTGTQAVLAIDPSIPAAIRVLGADAPPTATAWLTRLESLPNDRFLLQFGDADVAAQAGAGLKTPLTVGSLDPFLNTSEKPSGTPTPAPSPTAGAPAPPAGANLGTVAGARTDVLWPRGQVTASEIATMAGYAPAGGPSAVSILPSTTFGSGAKGEPVAPHGMVDGTGVLVTDAAVSDALSHAATASDDAQRGAALTEANAMLSFAAPGSAVLAGLSRADVRSETGLTTAVTSFAGTQDPHLSSVLSVPPSTLTVTTTSAEDRAKAIPVLNEDAARLAEFATILERPADLTVRETISIMRLLGVGVYPTPADFATALAAHREATEKTMAAVAIQPSNPILISAKVEVPIWVRNDLPYPVHVRLNVTASDPRIQVPAVTEIDAQASRNTSIKLPVEAGVANAEVDLNMTLTSATGVQIGPGQSAQLTIRAEWETIGLIVFGSIAALLIGAGIVRTIRRRRATAAKYAADGMDEEVAEETAAETPVPAGDEETR